MIATIAASPSEHSRHFWRVRSTFVPFLHTPHMKSENKTVSLRMRSDVMSSDVMRYTAQGFKQDFFVGGAEIGRAKTASL